MPTVKELKKLHKKELIKAIQTAECNSSCYQEIPDCCQMDYLFRSDCL
jgi:hypothetical protein